MRFMTLALVAFSLTTPAFAHDGEAHDYGTLGQQVAAAEKAKDHGTMDHSTMDHSDMQGIHTMATIHSIDGATVNLTHPPIPDLRWPAMTMDLLLLDGAEVGDVEAGDEAMLMLEQGADGMVGIRAMMPAK